MIEAGNQLAGSKQQRKQAHEPEQEPEQEGHFYELRSVDAWREPEGGWTHNASYHIESNIYLSDNTTTRQLLAFMRRNEWLNDDSKGKLRVVDEFDYLEVLVRGTGEPLYILWQQQKPETEGQEV